MDVRRCASLLAPTVSSRLLVDPLPLAGNHPMTADTFILVAFDENFPVGLQRIQTGSVSIRISTMAGPPDRPLSGTLRLANRAQFVVVQQDVGDDHAVFHRGGELRQILSETASAGISEINTGS